MREVHGGEEDFFDGLEEDLLASRGDIVEPRSLPFTGTTVPAVTGELPNQSQHQMSVMDMTANDSDPERGSARGNRFAALSDHDSEDDSGSDTITLNGGSDVEIGEMVEHTADSEPVVMEARVRAPVTAFSSLDSVNLTEVFTNRAHVMRSVPAMLKGAFRSALRVACRSQQLDKGNKSVEVAASAAQDALVPTHTWGIGATQEVGGQIQTISQWRVDAVVG